MNRNFNPPQSHQQREFRIPIRKPIASYYDKNDKTIKRLKIVEWPPREKEEVAKSEAEQEQERRFKYYSEEVLTIESYIDAAFRSTRRNEVYLFFQDEYVVLNYAPGTTNDYVVNGPLYVRKGFRSLSRTLFAAYGIDAAFGCHGGDDEAFVFCGNLCAKINYATDKILEGTKAISQMFPFFEGTKFEGRVDAAFESSVPNQVYIFKGAEYALIDYVERKLIYIRPIVDGFKCLQNTIFDSDIGAAFASHNSQEAYLFKGNSYVLLHFTPGETKDYIISGPKEIVPNNWPSLVNILPRDNCGCCDDEDEDDLEDEDEDDPNLVYRLCGNY